MEILTNAEILENIKARKSFWVGTDSERKEALSCAKKNDLKYRTGKDVRGGFYCVLLPAVTIPRPTKKKEAA